MWLFWEEQKIKSAACHRCFQNYHDSNRCSPSNPTFQVAMLKKKNPLLEFFPLHIKKAYSSKRTEKSQITQTTKDPLFLNSHGWKPHKAFPISTIATMLGNCFFWNSSTAFDYCGSQTTTASGFFCGDALWLWHHSYPFLFKDLSQSLLCIALHTFPPQTCTSYNYSESPTSLTFPCTYWMAKAHHNRQKSNLLTCLNIPWSMNHDITPYMQTPCIRTTWMVNERRQYP